MEDALKERLAALEVLVQQVNQRLAWLELVTTAGVPPAPVLPAPSPTPPARCSQCQLELSGILGYVCGQPRCPVGLGGVWASAD